MKKKYINLLLILSVIFIYGCTSNYENEIDIEKKSIDLELEDSQKTTLKLEQFAGTNSAYYRYNKDHFENSLDEGKIIFLDFHADWCPICARERPKILAAFNELNDPNVIGYEVHFNDKKTTADDKELAKKYGITYQYTKVFIDYNGQLALKTLEILDKDRILNEINKLTSG